jgi:hypothetical protein
MRRLLVFSAAVCIMASVAFPATSAAQSWPVVDKSGKKMGKVVRTAKRAAKVYSRSGALWGGIRWREDDSLYQCWAAHPGDTGVRKEATVSWNYRGYWWIISDAALPYSSAAMKKGAYWVVRQDPGQRLRGKVPVKCPGWAAGAAVFVLSKYMK